MLKTINNSTLWEEEKAYSDKLIKKDVRNNSAWNQRWFTTHQGNKHPPLPMHFAKSEAKYAIDIATMDPYNESPLRYLVALLEEQNKSSRLGREKQENDVGEGEEVKDDAFDSLLDLVGTKIEHLEETLSGGNESASLISAHIDILEMKSDLNSFEKGASMANDLGTKFDVIRKKYWAMRERKLRSKVTKSKE